MGEHIKEASETSDQRLEFTEHLLKDLKALEYMHREGMIESGIRRLGAEQEFCLVDQNNQPSMKGPQILESIDDPHFTTELARFNLEINLDPVELTGSAFKQVDEQLRASLRLAQEKAGALGDQILLTGILPSIGIAELHMDYMTPNPRYYRLAERIKEQVGGEFELSIQGIEELLLRHDNILFEACNTSFQVHFQIDADEFADRYNWAQAISGPVLSACTNSPLLLGRQLWSETRIALFQQSIDTRSRETGIRTRHPRVSFGEDWHRGSLCELYRDDIARFQSLLTMETSDSLKELEEGVVPKLKALALHNGTLWKWNRPCFGSDGKTFHIRIENRYLPSGPTVRDEMANTAFWVGLMQGMPEEAKEIWNSMRFIQTRENFHKACKYGLDVEMKWFGEYMPARRLILDKLLPLAKSGLQELAIDSDDIDYYLGIIAARTESGQTGSRWILNTYRSAPDYMENLESQTALTKALVDQRASGKPVHEWEPVELTSISSKVIDQARVDQLMTTDLYTCREDDLVELVEMIMSYRNIRHVPVEDHSGNLKGLITKSTIDRFWENKVENKATLAKEIMLTNLTFVPPSTKLTEAMDIMLKEKKGSLPVVSKGKLLGILTEVDMTRLWEKMKKHEGSAEQ
jgi:CBS domain-containing protein